jgi:ribosomal protein RSM22 (predicted rRNA methylase)
MQLPATLRDAIEAEISTVTPEALKRAAAELSTQYRTLKEFTTAPIHSEAHRIAYLATRMPATFASLRAVFAEMKNRLPEITLHSLLDLGSGPGTAMWAAVEIFPEIETLTNIESDRQLIELGKRLALGSTQPALSNVHWLAIDLGGDFETPPHDLVVLSYALGELRESARARVIEKAWQLTEKVLVIIEPGTPRGFQHVLAVRDRLIKAGAHLLAPCPGAMACPMAEVDWCHFAARVERAAFHRRAKAAALGHEDEKYSYLVAAKLAGNAAPARIVRHPFIQKGHIGLQLCTPEGLQQITVSKKHKAAFRAARKADWGDEWKEDAN